MARRSTSSAISRPPTAEPSHRFAGFTILELLVVIGIVIAIGAIAVPFTIREVDRRREAESIDRLALAIRLARAEAQATGVPFEIVVDERGRTLEARRVDPREPVPERLPGVDGIEVVDDLESPFEFDDRRVLAAWATVELAEGLSCRSATELDGWEEWLEPFPPSDDSLGFDEFAEDEPPAWDLPTRLLLCLPDGTVIRTREFGLRSTRGWRVCGVDTYSGRLVVDEPRRLEEESETLEEPEVEEEPEDLEFEESGFPLDAPPDRGDFASPASAGAGR